MNFFQNFFFDTQICETDKKSIIFHLFSALSPYSYVFSRHRIFWSLLIFILYSEKKKKKNFHSFSDKKLQKFHDNFTVIDFIRLIYSSMPHVAYHSRGC